MPTIHHDYKTHTLIKKKQVYKHFYL